MTPLPLFTDLRDAPARPAPQPLPPQRQVDLASLPARTALVRQTGTVAKWFDWSANPYRGCEFACIYCYARGTHEWLGHADPRDFERQIYVKAGFVEALRRDLRSRVRSGEHIAIGTATDPYQPIERREGLTRSVLRELSHARGIGVSVTTKSSLVTRDIDLLRQIAQRNDVHVHVHVTITTADARLARFLEPRAPAPSVRLSTVRALRDAGLTVGVNVMPIMPGINDSEADLRDLLTGVKNAEASYAGCSVVFLQGATRGWFVARLRRAYPRLAARYEAWTIGRSGLPTDVQEETVDRFDRVAKAVGVRRRGTDEQRLPTVEQRMFSFGAAPFRWTPTR